MAGGITMTLERQQIVIAEARGWKRVNNGEPSKYRGRTVDGHKGRDGFWVDPKSNIHYDRGCLWDNECLPNCAYDLNAMHEAEKDLTSSQWDDYVEHLGGSLYHCAHATAAQRAEAFLKTIGKWEDTE
jgi:hypothetical protein